MRMVQDSKGKSSGNSPRSSATSGGNAEPSMLN
jgi:hypothetical protein